MHTFGQKRWYTKSSRREREKTGMGEARGMRMREAGYSDGTDGWTKGRREHEDNWEERERQTNTARERKARGKSEQRGKPGEKSEARTDYAR